MTNDALGNSRRVSIPLGTYLSALIRVESGWQAWTAATKNKSNNPGDWFGTYLLLGDNGSVTRIQEKEDGTRDEWCIRPASSTKMD